MIDFTYCVQTKAVFGKGSIDKVGELTQGYKRIMVTYGCGSIKRNGVYDKVMAQIKDRVVCEFGGIEANPDHDTLMKAALLAREKNPDLLLAVGGGSVVDGTKYIAAAANWKYTDNPYDMFTLWETSHNPAYEPRLFCPLGCVLTLPATGTEMNGDSVISWRAKHMKYNWSYPPAHPLFCVLDPEFTYSLPKRQVANGLADAFVHVMEQYCGHYGMGELQDQQAEAIMRSIVDVAPRALEMEHPDYQARAEFFWCTTQALNGLIACGVTQCWATHRIGHEITAFYGLDHAVTLAITMPSLLRHLKALRAKKLARLAERVFGVHGAVDMAEEGILQCEKFFCSLGIATTFTENGCDDSHFQEIADKFKGRKLGEEKTIGPDEVLTILKNAI